MGIYDWVDLRNLKLDSLYDNYINWKEILEDEDESFNLVCEDVLDILDTLTVSNKLEDILKDVLILKGKFLLYDSISTLDTAVVMDYKELCPWQAGYALGIENSLYSRVTDSLAGFNIYPCDEPEPYQINPGPPTVVSGGELQVFPNPAIEGIHIKSPDLIQ